MIVKKMWNQKSAGGIYSFVREGWYLFGIVPLYIRDVTARP